MEEDVMMVLKLPNTMGGDYDTESGDDGEYDDEALDKDNPRIEMLKQKNHIIDQDSQEDEDPSYQAMMDEN